MEKYCIMPFASVRVEDINYDNPRDLSMGFRPCCVYRPTEQISFQNIHEYLNSDFLKNLQTHFLTQNTLPKECHHCQFDDDNNGNSLRSLKNKFFENEILTKTDIKEIDLCTSNTCNLRCHMCSPKSSSAIGQEQTSLGMIVKNYNFDETEKSLDTLDALKDVKHVRLSGGEFFYFKHAKRILQKICDINVPRVSITTNGTVFRQDHIELLKKIPHLTICFSLDGTESHYEFTRYPAKWSEVTSNIKKFKEALPHAYLETVIVMMPFSVPKVLEWLDYANTMGLKTHWLPCYSPTMNWIILDKEERDTTIQFILSDFKKHNLTDDQKLNLLTFLKIHIPNSPFDSTIRAQTIRNLASKLVYRKYPLEKIKLVTAHWPKFQKELLEIMQQINLS
jgi:hypothetical protein